MGKVTIYLHRSVHDFCDLVATALDTSRSEVVEDMIKHIRDNDLMEELWGEEYTEGIEHLEEVAEEAESEEESESEED